MIFYQNVECGAVNTTTVIFEKKSKIKNEILGDTTFNFNLIKITFPQNFVEKL